jgi:hypothetical protein
MPSITHWQHPNPAPQTSQRTMISLKNVSLNSTVHNSIQEYGSGVWNLKSGIYFYLSGQNILIPGILANDTSFNLNNATKSKVSGHYPP